MESCLDVLAAAARIGPHTLRDSVEFGACHWRWGSVGNVEVGRKHLKFEMARNPTAVALALHPWGASDHDGCATGTVTLFIRFPALSAA